MQHLTHITDIGQGGFGNVDLVQDASGNQFARKTFAKNQPLNPQMLQNVIKRFGREVKIQTSITHPNIVKVLYSDLNAAPPYYLMPVAIESLADEIDRDRTIGGGFVSAFSDIVAALEEMHSMQIFHRDLKPQNVLKFQKAGLQEFYYAVSDFGLISMKESQLSGLTKTGMRKSSDYYTAPEITKELRASSVQSDVYSLGCILHDMVGTEERVPCGEIREPGEYAAILLGCTRKDPSQRFKSARAVLDAMLSIEFMPKVSASAATTDFLSVLGGTQPTTAEFWTSLSDFIEGNTTEADKLAIYGALTAERIAEACLLAPKSANQIGLYFAEWVRSTAFNFDYCDALASRLETFFNSTNFETKVECLMALLSMGTSHNRWYVERVFLRLCGRTNP